MIYRQERYPLLLFLGLVLAGFALSWFSQTTIATARPVRPARLHELQDQVRVLERMVSDLSDRVEYLEQGGLNPADFVTCYLQTPFDGTFMATEPTESAAKAVVLYQCGNGTGCMESRIKCGK